MAQASFYYPHKIKDHHNIVKEMTNSELVEEIVMATAINIE
jgi:hypothetical protein